MKKLLTLLFIIPLLFSCKSDQKKITINGKIINCGQNYMIIYLPEGTHDTIKIDIDGNFTCSLTAPEEPVFCNLMFNEMYMPVYLGKGMNLKVTFDADDIPGSLEFMGEGADMNNYLSLKALKEKELNLSDYEILKKDTAAFFAWNDGIRETQTRFWDDFKKEKPSDIFWKIQKAEIDFGWANRMNIYPSYYKYFTDSTFTPGSDYYTYVNDMDLNNSYLLKSGEFKSFLRVFISIKASGALDKPERDSIKPSIPMLTMKTAVEILKNDSVRNYYLSEYAKSLISLKDFSEIGEELKFFRDNCRDKSLIAEFEKEYQSRLPLQKGHQAIEFEGETIGKEKVRLSDLKGKYVYVDVWATWCGPCKYEIPYLKKLEKDYHSKNIIFLSYSIDEVRKDWEKFVPENELKGVQVIGENGWQSKFCRDYKIFGVPTFMLFDAEGKIISVNMTRPSDDKTRKSFDALKGI